MPVVENGSGSYILIIQQSSHKIFCKYIAKGRIVQLGININTLSDIGSVQCRGEGDTMEFKNHVIQMSAHPMSHILQNITNQWGMLLY